MITGKENKDKIERKKQGEHRRTQENAGERRRTQENAGERIMQEIGCTAGERQRQNTKRW